MACGSSYHVYEPMVPVEAPIQKVMWQEYSNSAFIVSERTEKPVLIYLSAKDCKFCRKMNDVVFVDEEVIKYINLNFIPIKMMSSEEKFFDIVSELNLDSDGGVYFPTMAVFSSTDKHEGIVKHSGYLAPDEFKEFLRLGKDVNTLMMLNIILGGLFLGE